MSQVFDSRGRLSLAALVVLSTQACAIIDDDIGEVYAIPPRPGWRARVAKRLGLTIARVSTLVGH